ncbi:Fc.00g108100.m01.CDS01 [Cosmosporella sp. VM-42]
MQRVLPPENIVSHQALGSSIIQSRSFGGCNTCRRRRVKCDESRPTCSMCRVARLECGGYDKAIFFGWQDTIDPGTVRFRRPILTEEEREQMSQLLTSMVPPQLALRHLAQIDEECENVPDFQNIQVSHGPFGAFRQGRAEASPAPQLSWDWLEDVLPAQAAVVGGQEPSFLIETTTPAWEPDLNQSLAEPVGDITQQSFDLVDLVVDSNESLEMIDSILGQGDQNDSGLPILTQSSLPTFPNQFDQVFTPNPFWPLTSINSKVPPNAVILLRHYSVTFLGALTPFRHEKTPWHILFIPHAKNCLAALAMGEELDHASLCAFYGILAISAFSLGGASTSQLWQDQGKIFRDQSRGHCRLMIQTAYNIPKAAKYKTTLMALITMVQVSIYCGCGNQADYYFLEAEKLIRLRGLNRRKSRKVRLLHHCYGFSRMFHESTSIYGKSQSHRRRVRRDVEASGLITYSHDNLSFRLPNWRNLDQEMTKIKSQEEGENDLHLQRPGIFPATLYPEISGIPELWLLLLSLSIRLGKEKDAAKRYDTESPLPLGDFLSRAKAVERCLNRLRAPHQIECADGCQDRQTLDNFLDAIRYALDIYFYRRVYNLNASMLQQKVMGVRNCLENYINKNAGSGHGLTGFIWPAFIAACEAEEPKLQASFSNWFHQAAQQTGLHVFYDMLKTVEHKWEEKGLVTEVNSPWTGIE